MKSIVFSTLVVGALAYLAYSQSGMFREWANDQSGGEAAEVVQGIDSMKSELEHVLETLKTTQKHWQDSDMRITALESELTKLKGIRNYTDSESTVEVQTEAVSIVPEISDFVSELVVDEVAGVAPGLSLELANPAVDFNSEDLLDLIEKMQLSAAGM